jgi:putative acetyltransferase
MVDFDVRPERPEDTTMIDILVAAAFGSDENSVFVEAVRREAEVCLAEVAVAAGSIMGHAQWCDAPIIVDGKLVKGAYLTCLAVEPALQGRGIGSRLVQSGLQRLLDRGYEAATLLGNPTYYARFGFSPELAARIEAPHRSRGQGFQAVELVAGALTGAVMRSDFPAVITPMGPRL